MSSRKCLCPQSTVYVKSTVQFMSYIIVYVQEYSLFPQSTVHVLSLKFYSQEYSLCLQGNVYVLRVQFVS